MSRQEWGRSVATRSNSPNGVGHLSENNQEQQTLGKGLHSWAIYLVIQFCVQKLFYFFFCFAVRDSHPSASQELRRKPEVAETLVCTEQVCLMGITMCD